ncbi:MAG: hypothetical protein ACLQU2_08580 [Candidatus Binataceae bacterium]
MVKQTRRLVRYWKPVYSRPRGGTLIFFYAGRTPADGALFHHHHGDDLPHLHLAEAPASTSHDHDADQSQQGAYAHGPHHDHDHHDHGHHEPGHWHFAATAAPATVPLLVLALCWISFFVSDQVNAAHLLTAQQWARPPPHPHP